MALTLGKCRLFFGVGCRSPPPPFLVFQIQSETEELSVSKDKTTYELVVKKQRIEVSQEVYRAYYECRERERYLDRVHRAKCESLEGLIESGFSIECNSLDVSKKSAEEEAIKRIVMANIKEKLKLLEPEELFLIKEIFINDVSERALAKKLFIPQKTLNNRKKKILEKLKN